MTWHSQISVLFWDHWLLWHDTYTSVYPVITCYCDLARSHQYFILGSLVVTLHSHISILSCDLAVTSVIYAIITGCDFAQSHQDFILWSLVVTWQSHISILSCGLIGSHISNLCYNHWLWLCTVTSGLYPMITGCDLAKSHQYFILWLGTVTSAFYPVITGCDLAHHLFSLLPKLIHTAAEYDFEVLLRPTHPLMHITLSTTTTDHTAIAFSFTPTAVSQTPTVASHKPTAVNHIYTLSSIHPLLSPTHPLLFPTYPLLSPTHP